MLNVYSFITGHQCKSLQMLTIAKSGDYDAWMHWTKIATCMCGMVQKNVFNIDSVKNVLRMLMNISSLCVGTSLMSAFCSVYFGI